jgi:hypothetical protein
VRADRRRQQLATRLICQNVCSECAGGFVGEFVAREQVTIMNGRALLRSAVLTVTLMLSASGLASAGPGGGGGHGGGGRGHAGWGFHGGGRGRYGRHGGYDGRRGAHYPRHVLCCGGWGWGLGFYLPLLPWYYGIYWWDGTPFYYVDGNYYLWDDDAGEYEAVEPPGGLTSTAPPQGSTVNPAISSELFAYPKGGQSEVQQKQDREECSRWATGQTGFNPAVPAGGNGPGDARLSYLRAEAACLEARNYTVR